MRDRYLKVILTVIAIELLWLGLRDLAPRVSAQAAPMPVVITRVQIEGADGGFLPVALASISTDNHWPKPERGFRAEAIRPRPQD
jgi:hypothetical protein